MSFYDDEIDIMIVSFYYWAMIHKLIDIMIDINPFNQFILRWNNDKLLTNLAQKRTLKQNSTKQSNDKIINNSKHIFNKLSLN